MNWFIFRFGKKWWNWLGFGKKFVDLGKNFNDLGKNLAENDEIKGVGKKY